MRLNKKDRLSAALAEFGLKLGLVLCRPEFHRDPLKVLDIAANHPRQDRFTDIHNFLSSPPADRAVADQMGVDVAASGALDRVGLQILSDQKGLHLSQFE